MSSTTWTNKLFRSKSLSVTSSTHLERMSCSSPGPSFLPTVLPTFKPSFPRISFGRLNILHPLKSIRSKSTLWYNIRVQNRDDNKKKIKEQLQLLKRADGIKRIIVMSPRPSKHEAYGVIVEDCDKEKALALVNAEIEKRLRAKGKRMEEKHIVKSVGWTEEEIKAIVCEDEAKIWRAKDKADYRESCRAVLHYDTEDTNNNPTTYQDYLFLVRNPHRKNLKVKKKKKPEEEEKEDEE